MLNQPIKTAVVVDTVTFSVYGPFSTVDALFFAERITQATGNDHVLEPIINPVSLKNEGVVEVIDHNQTVALARNLFLDLKAIVTVHDTLSEQGREAASYTFDELIDQARATIVAAEGA